MSMQLEGYGEKSIDLQNVEDTTDEYQERQDYEEQHFHEVGEMMREESSNPFK